MNAPQTTTTTAQEIPLSDNILKKIQLIHAWQSCAEMLTGEHQLVFPTNDLGLRQGTLLRAVVDIEEMNLKAGDIIPIFYDGDCVVIMPKQVDPEHTRGLGWEVSQLINEIVRGLPPERPNLWQIVNPREMFTAQELVEVDTYAALARGN